MINRLIKKISICTLMLVLLAMQVVPAFAYDEVPEVVSKTAILMDANNNEIIFEKNADVKRTPASLTKMLTAILVVENLDFDKVVTVPDEAVGIYGNNMKLKKQEKLTVEQLMNAMLIYSANDAAITLAIEVAGSRDKFYEMMNAKAKRLGCKNSNFISENGLTNDILHHSTARDMALIASSAMKYKEIRNIVKKTECKIAPTNKSEGRLYKSTNRLLYDTKNKFTDNGKEVTIKYDNAIGIKTGYMSSSGYCLAAEAVSKDTKMIAVVLGGDEKLDRFIDSRKLLEYGLTNYKTLEIVKAGEVVDKVKVKRGSKLKAGVTVLDSLYVTLPSDGDKDVIEKNITIKKDLVAPVKKGDEIGEITLLEAGVEVASAKLVLNESIEPGGPWTIVGISDNMFKIIVGIIIVGIILILLFRKRNKRKKILREERIRKAREEKAMEIAKERLDKKKREWPY